MRVKQLLIVVGSVLILNGCFDDNSPPVYEDIEGVVLSGGEPLTDASVHIRNHFDPGGFIQTDGENTVSVSFSLQLRDLVTGNLYKNGGGEPFAVFFEDSLNSGNHEVEIPDSLLMNGILAYEIRNSSSQIATSLFVVNKPDSMLLDMIPFTTTNADGAFFMNKDALSLGQSFSTANGGGFDVTDSLQILITEGDEVIKTEKVRVKPDQSNYFEITID
ncbi:MAG: hypothetical protein WD357_08360 [Gracilimonas sp.]